MMSLFAQPCHSNLYTVKRILPIFFRASLSITATVHSEHKHSKKLLFT